MNSQEFRIERIFKGPGFAETLYLGVCKNRRVIRKALNPDAHAFSRTALIREIRLLLNLPDDLKPFFPEVLSTNLDDTPEDSPDLPGVIYYDLPYYPPEDGWVTLSDYLLDDVTTLGRARRILGEIVDTAFLYFRLGTRKPAPDYAECTMLRAIRDSMSWAFSDRCLNELLSLKNLRISGRPVRTYSEIEHCFQDCASVRRVLTPSQDRFLHGDFFPENIIYNTRTGQWILLDPVSVRGVHHGDFILDLNKMDDWLSGELPALRMGYFTIDITGSEVGFAVHAGHGKLAGLRRLGLSAWYRERLGNTAYKGIFAEEKGWELRWKFIKAFYAFCMVPLAPKDQAAARYFLALLSMDDFLERCSETI